MKTVLITGVNGFVGQHLARELHSRGAEVFGLGRDDTIASALESVVSRYFSCDLTNEDAVAKLPLGNVSAIVNLAGLASVSKSFANEALYKDVNVRVATSLGNTLARTDYRPRIIAISTGGVYDANQALPLTEDSKLTENGSPYVTSKRLMEVAVEGYKLEGLECFIARPFNHTGPGQESGFLIPDLYRKILDALAGDGHVHVGNLQSRRDYTDVRDIARAYASLALAEKDALHHAVYNICSGISRSGQEILDELKANIPGADQITLVQDPGLLRANDPAELIGNARRLFEDTAWAPLLPFKDTIRDFVAAKKAAA